MNKYIQMTPCIVCCGKENRLGKQCMFSKSICECSEEDFESYKEAFERLPEQAKLKLLKKMENNDFETL